MSAGIDKDFVRMHYKRMTDADFIQAIEHNLAGLTSDALKIIKEEIVSRHLDTRFAKQVDEQQKNNTAPKGYKVYDKNGCPVEEATRIWLEQSFLTLLSIFGEDNTKNRTILTPERRHFPIRYDGKEQAAFDTLRIIADQMEVSVEKIKLDFYDDELRHITEGSPGGLYWGKGEDDVFEISLVRTKLTEPENMVATLAHEIAHIKLLGENRMDKNDEFLTDLTTIFFGLGIFNANAAFQTFADSRYYGWSTSGYLSQLEWGYALSLFAYIRQEEQPLWSNYLCPNVKADFRQGQNFINANRDLIFQSV